MLIENYVPVVKWHGLNTDKAVVFGSSLSITGVVIMASTLAVTGALSLAGGLLSTSATAGIGYATGSGGAVTQQTNRATGVTLSKLNGQITTNNASLAGLASAKFTVTNTTVAVGDVVIVSIQADSNGGNTVASVTTVAAGSFEINVANGNAAAGTAETGAIIINYAVIKAVAA